MRAGSNVALQAGVLLAFAVLRVSAAGWLLVILVVTGIGLLTLVPLAFALAAIRRRVLRPALVAPFAACDLTLLTGALLMPDGGDSDLSWAPLWTILGHYGTDPPTAFAPIAFAAVLGYLLSAVWLIVAFVATAARRPAGPPPLPHGFPPGVAGLTPPPPYGVPPGMPGHAPPPPPGSPNSPY